MAPLVYGSPAVCKLFLQVLKIRSSTDIANTKLTETLLVLMRNVVPYFLHEVRIRNTVENATERIGFHVLRGHSQHSIAKQQESGEERK